MQHEDTLQVMRLDPKHTCSRVWENKRVKSSWLAQTFVEEVKTNPTVPVMSLKATMQRNINSGISLSKARRAKNKALKILEGLDGHHLKSPYGGQLLSAVGLDANNMTWMLVKDIELANQYGFTFISDKQKGLVEAFEEVVPNCDHRFCARHLSTNFSLVFKGKLLKDAMWRAAFATTVPKFMRAMELLRTLDGEAYTRLTAPERPPRHWSRSHFNTSLKCPILLNNLCESFNSWIMSTRSKPIISMMEEIKVKLMRRIQMRRDLTMRWERAICLRPLAKLETSKKTSC
ncbi:unnamed protein product [Prunus armeniaca]|uniref:MULE transposase domain-containing protein n=1 Tax=Prunus armeniaca TaxID=36596 RepID=A0A6J5VIK4_PRUAR|nr:unnamed protein product [Prunus armeniaca]